MAWALTLMAGDSSVNSEIGSVTAVGKSVKLSSMTDYFHRLGFGVVPKGLWFFWTPGPVSLVFTDFCIIPD